MKNEEQIINITVEETGVDASISTHIDANVRGLIIAIRVLVDLLLKSGLSGETILKLIETTNELTTERNGYEN